MTIRDRYRQGAQRVRDVRAGRSSSVVRSVAVGRMLRVGADIRNAGRAPVVRSVPRGPRRRGAWVGFRDDLSASVVDMINAIGPAMARAYMAEVVPFGVSVARGWPVRSGRSLDALDLRFSVVSGGYVASVTNDADYLLDMRFGRDDPRAGRPVWDTLAIDPVPSVTLAMRDTLMQHWGRR